MHRQGIFRGAVRSLGPAQIARVARLRLGRRHQAAVSACGQHHDGLSRALRRSHRQGYPRRAARCADCGLHDTRPAWSRIRAATIAGYRRGVRRAAAGRGSPDGAGERCARGVLGRRDPVTDRRRDPRSGGEGTAACDTDARAPRRPAAARSSESILGRGRSCRHVHPRAILRSLSRAARIEYRHVDHMDAAGARRDECRLHAVGLSRRRVGRPSAAHAAADARLCGSGRLEPGPGIGADHHRRAGRHRTLGAAHGLHRRRCQCNGC